MLSSSRAQFYTYSIAIGVVALALTLKLLVEQFIDLQSPFLLFIPAIALSAWFGNPKTGLLSTGLAILAVYLNWVDPSQYISNVLLQKDLNWEGTIQSVEWLLTPEEELYIGIFSLEGCFLSLLLGELPFPKHFIEEREEVFSNSSSESQPDLEQTCQDLQKQIDARTVALLQTSALLESQIEAREETRRYSTQVENALQESNVQLITILESIADGFCAIDRQWRFTYVNRQAEQLLGKTQAELLGKNMWDVYPQAIGTTFHTNYQKALTDNIPVEFEGFCSYCNRWLATSVYPSAQGLTIYSRDITHRKQIEEERNQLLVREQAIRAMAETAERRSTFLAEASKVITASLEYEATLESIADLLVPLLADYCLIFHNVGGQLRHTTAIHHNPEQQSVLEELAGAYRSHLHQSDTLITQAFKTKESFLLPGRCCDALLEDVNDPRLIDLIHELAPQSCIILPLVARDEVLGVMQLVLSNPDRRYQAADLSLLEEFSQRAAIAIDNAQLYRQAQTLNRMKDEFLATLSHELRTPLNALLGWAQLLQKRQFADEMMNRAVETIGRNARIQAQIVNDLLDVSRIITGRLQLKPQWTSSTDVIEAAITPLMIAAEAKEITLEKQIDQTTALLWVDPKYMQQVIWNIVSNAIKFTQSGGRVEVRFSVVPSVVPSMRPEEDGSCTQDSVAEIQVSDTGKGIDAEFLPYVFDRFRQADGSIRRTYGGLGLGLAIVRHLVELHGGTIEAESAGIGQGSTFTVRLPKARRLYS